MDDKTNNTTISAPAGAAKTNTSENKKPNGLKAQLPIIIAIIILLIGIGVALFFILRKPAETPTSENEDDEDTVIVWEPSEGSENPEGDYIADRQSVVSSPDSTDKEKFDALLEIANIYSATEKYDLYNAYVYLYEQKGDTANRDKYDDLSEEALFGYWDEEQPASESSGTGETATEE